MRIGIIGAGNMGGAIASGLASGEKVNTDHITVSCPNRHGELDALKTAYPDITVSTDNEVAVRNADLIVVAVKPWLLDEVMKPLMPKIDFARQSIVSVVAGATLDHLAELASGYCESPAVMSLIPNTAISVHESMTFLCGKNVATEQLEAVKDIFDELGETMIVDERLMRAGMALASCGIAYAMRYIRAASEGGVELGMYPDDAKRIVMQTLKGAVALLEKSGNHPESEIDKVTTPGGITIRGLNAMEANGFTNAVIEGLRKSVK